MAQLLSRSRFNPYSVSVGNIPKGASVYSIGDLYGRYGKVFIPGTAKLAKRMYGFVRFGDDHRAIKYLDGWMMWGSKSIVRAAKPAEHVKPLGSFVQNCCRGNQVSLHSSCSTVVPNESRGLAVRGSFEQQDPILSIRGAKPQVRNLSCIPIKQEGKKYDIVDTLSGPERNFLIRNNGDQVKVDTLKGKFVAIYLVRSMEMIREESEATLVLAAAYRELHPKGDFEIVFVGGVVEDEDDDDSSEDKDGQLFNRCFSKMPWLAIPPSDKISRESVLTKLVHDDLESTYCTILNQTGKVLSHESTISSFKQYGGQWYPFTKKRILQIEAEIDAASKNLSVNALLANSSRDYLITNKGHRVPISDLEGKVVGLFFYGHKSNDTVEKLKEIYMKLKERGEKFEIVLIHPLLEDVDENRFLELLESMPWLSLPFMDPNWWRLRTMFEWPLQTDYTVEDIYSVDHVVIIEPDKKRYDAFGGQVMIKFGIEAYPFTRERPAEIEFERIKTLKLESILTLDERNFLIGKNGSKVPFSEIKGKNILLFIANESSTRGHKCLCKVRKFYKDIKSIDDEFEVIYVPNHGFYSDNYSDRFGCDCECGPGEYRSHFSKVPWLTLSCEKDYADSFYSEVLNVEVDQPMLVTIGREGHLLSHKVCLEFDPYPFTGDELFFEILVRIANENEWTVRDEDGSECEIWM